MDCSSTTLSRIIYVLGKTYKNGPKTDFVGVKFFEKAWNTVFWKKKISMENTNFHSFCFLDKNSEKKNTFF